MTDETMLREAFSRLVPEAPESVTTLGPLKAGRRARRRRVVGATGAIVAVTAMSVLWLDALGTRPSVHVPGIATDPSEPSDRAHGPGPHIEHQRVCGATISFSMTHELPPETSVEVTRTDCGDAPGDVSISLLFDDASDDWGWCYSSPTSTPPDLTLTLVDKGTHQPRAPIRPLGGCA